MSITGFNRRRKILEEKEQKVKVQREPIIERILEDSKPIVKTEVVLNEESNDESKRKVGRPSKSAL